jgi:sugar phosphate isomerase/epimerase
MPPLRLAVATRCLNRPLRASLILASQIGAVGIQLDARNEVKPGEMSGTGVRQFLHLLNEHGLKVASLDMPTSRGLCDRDGLDARIEAVKEAMELAYQLEARIVTVRLGALPKEQDEPGRGMLKTVLNDLARHGNAVGTTLALGPGRDVPGRLITVLDEVSEGPLGINFDPTTFVGAGQTPSDVLRSMGAFVSHVVVRDATPGADGLGNEVPVGRGVMPWKELLSLLYEMNYSGWLTVDRTQGDDRAGDAVRAIKFLQSLDLR